MDPSVEMHGEDTVRVKDAAGNVTFFHVVHTHNYNITPEESS